MKRSTWLLLVLLLALAACAAGPNPDVHTAGPQGIAGFWMGLWHGLIAPVAFVVSLFKHDIGIYEVHNNGALYNLGYLLGLSCVLGGSGGAARRGRRR